MEGFHRDSHKTIIAHYLIEHTVYFDNELKEKLASYTLSVQIDITIAS